MSELNLFPSFCPHDAARAFAWNPENRSVLTVISLGDPLVEYRTAIRSQKSFHFLVRAE